MTVTKPTTMITTTVMKPEFDFASILKTGTERIAGVKQEARKQMFGNLILEKHLSLLFADQKCNKSVLAYQIAEGIASGAKTILGLPNQCSAMNVLYIDCELENIDCVERYGNYKFHKNLKFLSLETIDKEFDGELVIETIEKICKANEIKFMVLDNLVYWLGASSSSPAVQFRAIKEFKRMCMRLDITLLMISHMNKKGAKDIITADNMAGGKTSARFINSAFCINKSIKGTNIRYVKQILTRSSSEDRILELSLVPPRIDYKKKEITKDDILHLNMLGFGTSELEHLPEKKNDENRKIKIDWALVFGKDKELGTSELTKRLYDNYKQADSTARNYIYDELIKVGKGKYRRC